MDSTQEQEQKIVKGMLEKLINNTYNEMLKAHPEQKEILDIMKKNGLKNIGVDYFENSPDKCITCNDTKEKGFDRCIVCLAKLN